MATIEMTAENIDATIEGNDIVFVDFWAEWCGPCKAFGPVFEAAAESHTDIAFAKVDTDDQQVLAGQFGIRSIPTLAVFREKVMVFMQPGSLPASAVETLIGQVRELDMDDVRAKATEAQKEQGDAASNA